MNLTKYVYQNLFACLVVLAMALVFAPQHAQAQFNVDNGEYDFTRTSDGYQFRV